MISTLDEAKRAAYRGAFRGLEYQGFRRAVNPQTVTCVLRFEQGGKTFHCAVGWLTRFDVLGKATWEDRGARFVSGSAYDVTTSRALSEPLQQWYDAADTTSRYAFDAFLADLQEAHDASSGDPMVMEQRLLGIGKEIGEPRPKPLCAPMA